MKKPKTKTALFIAAIGLALGIGAMTGLSGDDLQGRFQGMNNLNHRSQNISQGQHNTTQDVSSATISQSYINDAVEGPQLISFYADPIEGVFTPGSRIDIYAQFDEPLRQGSTMQLDLSSGGYVLLVRASHVATDHLVGLYEVRSYNTQDTTDLNVTNIVRMSVIDEEGNVVTSAELPDGNNLADNAEIDIDVN